MKKKNTSKMVVLFEYCVNFIMEVNTPQLLLPASLKDEKFNFQLQPVNLRILLAISGLQHPRKDLFSSQSILAKG